MIAQLLTPAYLPFTFSFVLMLGIGLIEAIGFGLGHLDLDGDANVDGDAGLLAWLGLGGEMPILIWLTSLLACFTIVGSALQQGVTATAGAPLSWPAASGAALVIGLMLNTLVANVLARVMPGFETTAITTDDLLRSRGTILEGTARRGLPARAKVIDRHGQAHLVMVEPQDDAGALAAALLRQSILCAGRSSEAVPIRRNGAEWWRWRRSRGPLSGRIALSLAIQQISNLRAEKQMTILSEKRSF